MPPASEKRRRNVLAVIEMFAGLGLPVCDDEKEITARRDEQRSARNRELNSTKGTVAAKAQQWFDSADALLNRRDELLLVVYEEFSSLAETVLKSTIESGTNVLGPDTQLALRDLATSWCRARADLANRWLADFLEQHGLTAGGLVEKSRLVEDLRARPRRNKVLLSWKFPEEGCEEVYVVRTPDPPTGEESFVYQGKDRRFTDTSVTPGAHHAYRVYSVLSGRRSLMSATASTRHEHAGGSSLKLQLAAFGLVAVGLGLVGWDRISGGTLFARGADQPAAVGSSGTHDDAPLPTAEIDLPNRGSTRRAVPRDSDPLAHALDTAPDDPAGTDGPGAAEPASEPSVEAEVEAPTPPDAHLIDPPSLAFAGSTLQLKLACDRPLLPEMQDLELTGLTLKRYDFDLTPPAIVFEVTPLLPDEESGRAHWSFRLADADGLLSQPISGQCIVLPR
ncbi:MAG: hypothetical protein H6825_14775 [Planctomycetes bacterium]|nr:hypothetical protein [Planctomycetota bacterium]